MTPGLTPGALVWLVLICLGGAAVAVQASINAALSRSVQSPITAAMVSFGVGFVVLAILSLASGGAAPILRLGSVPVWQLVGGLLGAFYVWSMISGVASLGVVTAMAAMILGQMVAALVLDSAGVFGLVAQPVSLTRIIAVVLVAAGVVLSRL